MNSLNTYQLKYIKVILIHILIGVIIFVVRPLSYVYSLSILFLGVFYIFKNKNRNNESLYWASYIVTAEVFIRMTKGYIGYDFVKYSVLIFVILGIYFDGISKKSLIFILYLLFLIPGVIYGVHELSFDTDIRKAIIFNLLGPICLGFSSLYLTEKKITLLDFDTLTRWLIYPLITMSVYVFLYNPSVRDVITGTESTSVTSGGYGPNQVSTFFGLGMFLAFVRFVLFSKSKNMQMLNLILTILFAFRGIITFSRGGIYTGVAMVLVFIFILFLRLSIKGKVKIGFAAITMLLIGVVVFFYSVLQSNGMLLNRYQGVDALGREKSSKFSGREVLAQTELNMFFENPLTGIGVGKNKEYREEETGIDLATHNEITRMLAEHGALGVINLLILFLVPFIFYFSWNRKYIFMIPFWLFWFLTINHAAMRTAAPAFIYALTLLKFDFTNKEDENTLHREQIK